MRPIHRGIVPNLALTLALFLPQVRALYQIHCPEDAIPGLLDQGTSPCYLFEDYPTQYVTAEQRCRVNGGHLVSIHDAFTNTFIAQVGDEAFGILKVKNFWIGANRLVKGKSWTWIDGTALNYTHWAEGEPKSGRSQCASIGLRQGQWKAESCLEKKRYVCEIPQGSSSTSSTVPETSTTSRSTTSSTTKAATDVSTPVKSTTSEAHATTPKVTKVATTASKVPSEAPSTTKENTAPVVTTEKQPATTATSQANTEVPSTSEPIKSSSTTEGPLETTTEAVTEAPTTSEVPIKATDVPSTTTTPEPVMEAKTTTRANTEAPSTSNEPTAAEATTTTQKASTERSSTTASVTERQTKPPSPEETTTEVKTKTTTETPTTTGEQRGTSEQTTESSTVNVETEAPVTALPSQGTTTEGHTKLPTTSKAPTRPRSTSIHTTEKASSTSVGDRTTTERGTESTTTKSDVTETDPATTTTATTTRGIVDDSWVCVETLGACYLVIKSPLGQTWSGQRGVCLEQESDLTSVHSLAENQFVANLISGENGDAPLASIGLHADGESVFKWTDGTNAAFTLWDQHEPKRSTKSSCAVLDRVALNHWRSLPCDDKRFTFVCKKPFGAAITTKQVATTSTKATDASTTAPITAWVSCPDASWTYDEDTAACYKVYDDEGTWAEQRERCQKTPSADLASIHSDMENSFIGDLALDADEPILSIGLTNNDHGSEFSWSDGTFAGYSNWDGPAPSGPARCAVLSAVAGGKWKALPCEDLTAAFVCKVHLVVTTSAEPVTTINSQSTQQNSKSTPPPTASNPNECDSKWSRLENTGTCYKVQSSPHGLNWTEQRVRCIEEGSDLASVHSAAENAFISGLARQTFEPIVSIGLRTHSGKYEWSDGTKIAYTNWESEKPNTNGQCTVLTTIGAGQWQSIPCDTVQFAYVCKKAPKVK
ncbi:macrophage mannose receptor 1-like protein [Aphelenchoides avenae]|nr:macrophage mannose receptor 1-like protein [Aphelenchus avenae]